MKRLTAILAACTLMTLVGCDSGAREGKPVAATKVALRNVPSLGFTAEEFQERFNTQAQRRKMELRVSFIRVEPESEEADKWLYQFDNRTGFLAMINREDERIRSITYMGSGDGSPQSGLRLMFAFMMLIRAIDPALSDDTANDLAFALFEAMKNESSVERFQNGMRYASLVVKGMGFVVQITPA